MEKVEVTENFVRIPNPKHADCESNQLKTITISEDEGIKALYCTEHKKIKTYLFDKEKWTVDEAKEWVEENAKDISRVYEQKWAKGNLEMVKRSNGEDENGKLGLAIISTETADRHGDVLKADGWDFSNFKKNPTLLWSHNATAAEKRPAIGKAEDIRVEDGKVYFTPVFDMEDKFAKEIYRKYKDGFLNAFSVGFLPKEFEETDTGYVFEKQEALEFSCVNVPANPEATVLLRDAGMEVSKDFCDWKTGVCKNDEIEDEEIKGVISYSVHGDSPKADEGADWDAGAEVKKATGDGNALREMHTWVDSDAEDFDEDERQWYKLPHHRGSGEQAVVWSGVKAAMAALHGARGGVDIPGDDYDGVYNHLAKHYEQFDKEPPEKKHFEIAIDKVARGKEKKKEEAQENKSFEQLVLQKHHLAKVIKETAKRLGD